jgi:hypothetical protein
MCGDLYCTFFAVEDMADPLDTFRFLLAQLHLDSLTDKLTPKAIKLALAGLPKGSDALDCAYKEAMERIGAQKPGFTKLAKQTLSLITCARTPFGDLRVAARPCCGA